MGNAPIQMGLKTHKQTYQHGEKMTGTVYVSVNTVNASVQNYQGIRLQFSCHENTEIRIREETGSGNDRHTTHRTERESAGILHVEVPLTTFQSPLRVARYEFPFEWQLPNHPLPSSFRHKYHGDGLCEVRYTLSAYLFPQQQSGFFGTRKNSATFCSQTIQFVGAPTRSIPEPLNLAEERTIINGLCCCWKQGSMSLGWEADTVVLTPMAPCHLQIWGSNTSAIPVHCLRVQLLQSVRWQAGNGSHTRNNDTTLVDFRVDVSHLPQWDPVLPANHGGRRNQYEAANQHDNNEQQSIQPVAASFQVPADVMDTYQGMNCRVEHTLIVSAVTRTCATTPSVSYSIHLQRMGLSPDTAAASLPVATAWMEEPEYTDVVLPSDWTPDEKVPVIHLTEITALEGNNSGGGQMAMAQAVAVNHPGFASAPPQQQSYPATGFAAAPSQQLGFASPPPQQTEMKSFASPAVVAPSAPPVSDDPMAFARPSGGDVVEPSAPSEDQVVSSSNPDLDEVFGMLQDIDPDDPTTLRIMEQQIQYLPVSQKVMATLTPDQFQYLCSAGTPQTISSIAFLLAVELNNNTDGGGFRGEHFVALLQLPAAATVTTALMESLTDQICDLPQSADYVAQFLNPTDAKWFRQQV